MRRCDFCCCESYGQMSGGEISMRVLKVLWRIHHMAGPLCFCLSYWKEESVGDLYFLSHFCSFDPVANPGGRPCFHFTNEAFARLNDLSMVTWPESDDRSQGESLRAQPSQSRVLTHYCVRCALRSTPGRVAFAFQTQPKNRLLEGFPHSGLCPVRIGDSLFYLPQRCSGTVGCTYRLLTLGGICL